MALINNGIKFSIAAAQVPSGVAARTLNDFSDEEYIKKNVKLEVSRSVPGATEADIFDNIFDDVSLGLFSKIETSLTEDYDTVALDVDYWVDLRYLDSNIKSNIAGGNFYTQKTITYVCIVDIYIKVNTASGN